MKIDFRNLLSLNHGYLQNTIESFPYQVLYILIFAFFRLALALIMFGKCQNKRNNLIFCFAVQKWKHEKLY
ncbi:protein of unknown function [Candidatus Nitrosocosmicus franklandus]|uniref:Uncharacterized protein n=1 Tax=Candidatus Nitrosocosmicus franklandianus TaxID=1798806 RepID=A0A484ID29_9ARCH|nr:protein of unknown function [Candidatus Nitrosocosmicus franklandus]